MSTTIPSASSAARRKVASTTNVAPWSRCAGPKTSPRKEWAIITWSRTVTLNTGLHLVVGDRVAERRQASCGQPGHDVGQLRERRGAAEQGVEGRVAQQLQGQREPIGRGAAPAARGGDGADLAGADRQPAGVERAAEGEAHLGVAVPAEVDDGTLRRQQLQ